MAQARSGSQVESKINLLAFGAAFSGKSTLGLQMSLLKNADGSPFKLLILDCENGSVDNYIEDFEKRGVNPQNIYIVYSQSISEVNHYIELVANNEDLHVLNDAGEETDEVVLDGDGKPFRANGILLDGSSILNMTCQQSLLNLSRKRAKVRANKNNLVGDEKAVAIDGASLELKDWNTLKYAGQSLVLNLAASNVSWVITAREKADTIRVKNNRGEIETVNTGKFIPEGFNSVDYNCKTVVRMFRDEDTPDIVKMEVIKDRTGVFAPGQIVEDPTLEVFQPMINKKGVNKFVVKNTMEEAIEIESKMFQKQTGAIEDESDVAQSSPMDLDIESLRKEVKKHHSKMNPEQRKQFSDRIKAEGLPTSLGKIEDTNEMSRVVDIAKEIVGAD